MVFDPASLATRLSALFHDPDMFRSSAHWQKAGFAVAGEGRESSIMVASHPSVPECLVKKYSDKVSPKEQLENYRRRAEGAEKLREFIAARRLAHVVVPRKFLHELPPAFARKGVAGYALVVERFALLESRDTKRKLGEMSREVLRELCEVLIAFRDLDSGTRNAPFTSDGQIAFIDTERWNEGKKKKHFLRYIREYLSDDQRAFADDLYARRATESPPPPQQLTEPPPPPQQLTEPPPPSPPPAPSAAPRASLPSAPPPPQTPQATQPTPVPRLARLAIAMTTAPRRTPTVHGAVASLRGAGFKEPVHLFAEPGTFDHRAVHLTVPSYGGETILHDNPRTLGCYGNWRQALGYLVAHGDARWLLVVQDDAIWRTCSADVLYAHTTARQDLPTGFLSPYVTASDVPRGAVDGWNECLSGWNLCGALAICLKREDAEALLRHPRFAQHPTDDHVDSVIAQSMVDLGLPSYVHVPSLVEHVGRTSTLNHDDVSPNLRGYRFGDR